jgi:putative ABC transport system substrate-binding protein
LQGSGAQPHGQWWRAQQPAVPVIGWLSGRNSETDAHLLPAFRRGLNRQGYVEGRNVTIEYRWSDTQHDRLPALAADLVHRQAAVIVTAGEAGLGVRAVQGITTTIPIVSATLSASPATAFRRGRGNVTGAYAIVTELGESASGFCTTCCPAQPRLLF